MSKIEEKNKDDSKLMYVRRFTVGDVKSPVTVTAEELAATVAGDLRLAPEYRREIIRRSLDARDKSRLEYVWQLGFEVDKAVSLDKLRRLAGKKKYSIGVPAREKLSLECGNEELRHRPVIVGSGPAGLFAAYLLAEKGYCPIVLERGRDVDRRAEDVERYWSGGPLHPRSNVQYGEGGAGTFSDGKLTSRSKNPRSDEVLKIFYRHGAPNDILWMQKPHIGTDILRLVVKNMREAIIAMGGTFYFETQVVDLLDQNGKSLDLRDPGARLSSIKIQTESQDLLPADKLDVSLVILAIGHSARDSYRMLMRNGLELLPKPFAVGLRIEHPQDRINLAQYGKEALDRYGKPEVGGILAPADYQLSWQLKSKGRGVYTFCMCPGGRVVASASADCRLVVNGMSYRARDLENANSAVLCTVGPEDFGYGPEDGLLFQEELERRAWFLGQGLDPDTDELPPDADSRPSVAPVQCVGDFIRGTVSQINTGISPSYLPATRFNDLRRIFPPTIAESLAEGLQGLDEKLLGFAADDAILTGVESRSSAPLRIIRDKETLEATRLPSLYPIGEGAGYAGGIVSSAIDGLTAAEAVIRKYSPLSQ